MRDQVKELLDNLDRRTIVEEWYPPTPVPKIDNNFRLLRYVYFFQGELTKLIKIGFTRREWPRIKELQSSGPDNLIPLLVLEGPIQDETSFKRKFAEYKDHNEWFKPAPEIINFIENLAEEGLIE